AAHAVALQRHGLVDDLQGGDRPGYVGAADSGHSPVRRRTRPNTRRPTPGPYRGGSRRHIDGFSNAASQVVDRAPRRAAHAPPSSEQKRSRYFPARPRAIVDGRRSGRLVTPVDGSPTAGFVARLSLCAAATLG